MRTKSESKAARYGSVRKAETTVRSWFSTAVVAVAWQTRERITTNIKIRFFIFNVYIHQIKSNERNLLFDKLT